MKYRKKPVEIEAMQFRRDNWKEIVAFTDAMVDCLTIEKSPKGKCTCRISTLEGNMFASEGDYIIKGIQGEFYPCKPDIFEQTYERVES